MAESLALSKLPNGSAITLSKEIFVPANTDYVGLNSVVCGKDFLVPQYPLVCHCGLEVIPSGQDRKLLIGHKISVKKSVTYDLSSSYGLAYYRGYENHLEVGDGVVNRIVCGQNDTISDSITETLSIDEFKMVLEGVGELSTPQPTPIN